MIAALMRVALIRVALYIRVSRAKNRRGMACPCKSSGTR